jgi:dipeptide transport system substrate-binding protein
LPKYFDYLDQHPDVQAGEMGWGGYPAPFDFASLATCAGVGGGQNYARFCDPTVDASIDSALALEARSRQDASDAWVQVDRTLTDDAPYLPLFVQDNAVVLSSRLRHYEVSAPYGPIYDEAWLR